MSDTDWNEVGERFNRLGRAVQGRWSDGRADADAARDAAARDVRSAMDRVNASLDDLAGTITRTANDPDVRDAATSAAGGLVEALSSSLDHLAGRIQGAGRRDDVAPGADPPRSGDRSKDV